MMEVQSLLQNLRKEVFCSLCENKFTDPKQLLCLHSFCLHCLNELQQASESRDVIICPECLKQCKAPASGDLKDLPTNARINSLLDAITTVERNATERKCGNCSKSSRCSYYSKCATFLYEECITLHNKDKAKEKHEVTASSQDQDLEILQQAARQLSPVLCFGEAGFIGLEDSSGKFTHPWGVAVNEQNDEIAVTDSGNNRVQVFRSDGSHLVTFGSHRGFKTDRNGEFDYPTGIVFDTKGRIIVADTSNNRVQIFDGRGKYLSQFGKEGSLDHELMKPYGLSVDSDGNIIVADTGNMLIKFFTPGGEFICKLGGEGILKNAPHCIQQGQNFLVSDLVDHCIKIFDLKGNYLYNFGKEGEGDGDFKSLRCLLVTQAGQLVVCDSENHRVQVFEQSGKFFTKFGRNGSEIGEFYYPTSLAVFSDGKIAVADMYNHRIQIFK